MLRMFSACRSSVVSTSCLYSATSWSLQVGSLVCVCCLSQSSASLRQVRRPISPLTLVSLQTGCLALQSFSSAPPSGEHPPYSHFMHSIASLSISGATSVVGCAVGGAEVCRGAVPDPSPWPPAAPPP